MVEKPSVFTGDSSIFEVLGNIIPFDFLAVLPVHIGDFLVSVFWVRIVLNVNLVLLSELVEFNEVGERIQHTNRVFHGNAANCHDGSEHHRDQ
ncbi:unannotated protein [freshwater metagenome]|uniref:Unannotated protein n=1 Tax=freshwater metagenome TaxID=449393 RepID=A0A6J6G689_9ZZZZ